MKLKKLLSVILSPLVLGSYSAGAAKRTPRLGDIRTLGRNVEGLSYAKRNRKRNRKKNERRNNMKVLEDVPGNDSALKCVGYLSAAILSPFLLYAGYKLFKKCFLDDVPKEKIHKISDEIKNYHTKKKLSQTDVEYENWLKKLPKEVVRGVIGEMPLDAWSYFLDNFENEIDLEIYVGMHDRSVEKKYSGIQRAIGYDMDNRAATRQGIVEHEMKILGVGLPFEGNQGMKSGMIDKKSMGFYFPFDHISNNGDIEEMRSDIFCLWNKSGEGRNAEELSSYVAATFNEYIKELYQIRSSNKEKFNIGMNLDKDMVREYLDRLNKDFDMIYLKKMLNDTRNKDILEKFASEDESKAFDEFIDDPSIVSLGKCGGFEKLKGFLKDTLKKDTNELKLEDKFMKRLSRYRKKYSNTYEYLFNGNTRPEKWEISTATWKGTKDDKIIELIVRVCQALIQTHTFKDGNTRANTCWLLNKLLVDNGFLPVAFGYSTEEVAPTKMFYGGDIKTLINVVRKGQQNFVGICEKNGLKIPSVVKWLK